MHSLSLTASPRNQAAFTLIELLVVIVIIVTLVAISFPVMANMRKKGQMVTEINAGRQSATAFVARAAEFDGELLQGFQFSASVTFPNGDSVGGPEAQRYPWRLAPYLQWNANGVFAINDLQKLVVGMDQQSSAYRYQVSLAPALGMNAYCVGGYETATGPLAKNDVSTRLVQLERPLVTFISARTKTSAGGMKSGDMPGSHFVRPPVFSGVKWKTGAYDDSKAGLDYGNVDFRYHGKAVATFTDGSSRLLDIEEARDMRLWARNADTATYSVKP
jgi:prepilin-type N-terminal cleavage/methylation domain-containing protein